MRKIYAIFLVVLLTASLSAQSPQKMSYQCVVRNASGVLVTNQSVGIKISILQGTPTGTVVYQENYNPNPQTDANGLVSIEIGGGTPLAGTFSAINWALGSYFLKTETDPTGGSNYTISGTSQLLSVPYALYSASAGNSSVWGLIGNNIYYNSGNVGIGSVEPVGKLEVVGQDALRLVGYQPFLTLLDANAGYARGRIQSAKGNILFYPESFIVGGAPAVTIFSGSGNVGIGTQKVTDYKLSVGGKIICEELKVQLAGSWPDYVFDKKYQLMPLDELAKSIEQEKHLPGLPSAADVQQDGISVGEIQSELLEKVEQLTLYVIQLQKQNAELVKKDAEIMKLINNSIDCNH
jgi:hypothetical protein